MLDIKIVEVGYFLSRRGVSSPPSELKVDTWKEAFECFSQRLNYNKTEEEFNNSLKNVRDHFDSYLKNSRKGWYDKGQPDRLPEQYKFILGYLKNLSDEKLWEYIKPYCDQKNKNQLNWKFDISTFRLLGRDLITDRITALVELVKNSYDANSENIYIKFYNAGSNKKSKIVISDDGFGMTSDDIRTKWMTIGTDSKRKMKFTPEPYNRRSVGEKGVGRFAIDKLGSHCRIFTKNKSQNKLNILTINWKDYSNNITDDFQKVNNYFKTKKCSRKKTGTRLVINDLHDIWTNYDLDRTYKEMSKIVSPFNTLSPAFNIYISSNEYERFKEPVLVKNDAIKYSTESFLIDYDLENKLQEEISFVKNKIQIKKVPINNFGPIKFQLYFFDQSAKGNFSKNYKGAELQIDGIKIYRDGILATPFAEHQANRDHQRDVLGIDKRRWSGFFDKIGSRDVLGVIEIKKEHSPFIIDATNRQDFIDNQEYRDLKEFLISQIKELEKYLKYKKSELYNQYDEDLENAKNELDNFSLDIKDFKNNLENDMKINVEKEIKKLEKTARTAVISLKQGLKKQKDEKKEFKQKESMFKSLMSLQTYALEITHIIKTSLAYIKRRAEFNNTNSENEKFKDHIKSYNNEIMNEIDKLDKAIDFMSTYTRSEKNWENFDVKPNIESVFESYSPILEKENIKYILDLQNNITLNYNNFLLEDIIKNLINNSIKAFKDTSNKIIKLSSFIEDDSLVIIFSDNGEGIDLKNKNKIFEIYYTTTAEEGGNGMGLYMVKTNLDAIQGSIDLIKSEIDNGATFKLILPFKR